MNMHDLEPSAAPRRRGLPLSTIRQDGGGGGGGVSQSLLSAVMISSGEPIVASAPPASRAGALSRAPGTRGSMSLQGTFSEKQLMMHLGMPFSGGSFSEGAAFPSGNGMGSGAIPVRAKEELGVLGGGGDASGERERVLQGGGGGGPKLDGGRGQLMRRQRAQPSFVADAPVSMPLEECGHDDRQGSFKADAPFSLEDDVKLEEDRRELMTKQQVQSSFVADAPVSLEQVRLKSL